jgi:hypothetical protein
VDALVIRAGITGVTTAFVCNFYSLKVVLCKPTCS